MTEAAVDHESAVADPHRGSSQGIAGSPTWTTLAVTVVGSFVITFDAVVVNVALPAVRDDLGGGIAGLQWVVDGYTLMFAALLLTSGSLTDRVGPKRALAAGMVGFLIASLGCGLAPNLTTLVTARFLQGAAAAVMMPASMALLRHAYPDSVRRARAVGTWAMGAAVASTSGPVLGGLMTSVSWRLIFLINLPIGLVGLLLLRTSAPTLGRRVPIDWGGQIAIVLAMAGLTFSIIEVGARGIASWQVVGGLVLTGLSALLLLLRQLLARHPVFPPALLHSRTMRVAIFTGFAFMVGFYGMPFVFSLYLQGVRGVGPLGTGVIFVPMMLVGLVFTPLSARTVERFGTRRLVAVGLSLMATGLCALALLPIAAPTWLISLLTVLIGLSGPMIMPPITAVLLDDLSGELIGVASGLFNTSRQVGGALAVALFGTLLTGASGFMCGLRISMLMAGAVAMAAAVLSLSLSSTGRRDRAV